LVLLDHLQRDNEPRHDLARQVHGSELSLTQVSPYLEIFQ
jgi:hypothetical protein